MLRNIANDLLYLLSILESIGKILKYTEKYSEPELFFESDDQIQFNASLLLLANIGEASGKISDGAAKLFGSTQKDEWQTAINVSKDQIVDAGKITINSKEFDTTEKSFDDFIDYWHTSEETRNISLHDAIGISFEEYGMNILNVEKMIIFLEEKIKR